jgi:hypothetical protein
MVRYITTLTTPYSSEGRTRLKMDVYWDYSEQKYCAQMKGIPKTSTTRDVLRPILLRAASDTEALQQGKALFEDVSGAIWETEAKTRAETETKTKAEIESTAKSWAEAQKFSEAFIQDLLRPEIKAEAENKIKAIVRDLFAADQD